MEIMLRSSLLIGLCLLATGCGTVVPPGKKVILVHPSGENEIVETGSYKAWGRTRAFFLDEKYISKTEDLNVLCEDDINLKAEIKVLVGFDTSSEAKVDFIKSKVPAVASKDESGKELSLDKFYEMILSDIARGTARNIVSQHQTDAVRPKRKEIEAQIQEAFTARVTELGYPVTVSAVLLSNIDYPESVTQTREAIKQAQLADEEKAALAEAALSEAQRQVAIEEELAKVRMVRAQAQADENRILTESLTPEFLMWRQFEVMEDTAGNLARGESNTVFMMPYQTMSPDMLNTAVIRDSVK